jgi:prepilin-type N-terminal cleavage/methylation domain-containing protein
MTGRLKTGFTLLELMVVVGIIAFLMSIIVPVVGRAKDQSRLIICRSNQKSLFMGCLTFANDNDSKLPVDKQLHNPHVELIESLYDGRYIEEPGVYYCPSEKKDDLKYSEVNFSNANIGFFYYCYANRPTNRYLSTFFLKSVGWPRVLKDTMPGNKWVFSDSWFSGIPTAHRWYKKGVNYITLDGSIQMVKQGPRSEFK